MGLTEYELNSKAIIAKEGVVRKEVTIAAGANLVAGTILGRITVGRKFMAYDADGTDDGRRTPVCVLLEDAAAASADVQAVVGFAGAYVKANMTGLDQAGEDALEAKGLYFL